MNETGGPVSTLAKFYKVPVERIVAVHDELDIPFDTMRVKLGGGDNGHNGLRSMRKSLGSGDFHRVRVGIGRPPGRQDPADFVLSDYSSAERRVVPFQVDRAADAVETPPQRGPRADPEPFQQLTPRSDPVTSTPTPSADVLADDHRFAAWAATVAGELLTEVRAQGLEGKRAQGRRRPGRARPARCALLAAHRPGDAVLSEEGKDDKVAAHRRPGLDRRPARRHP